MGFDWEFLLGAEGADLADAYNASIQDDDWYGYDSDPYDYEDEVDEIEYQNFLLSTPLHLLSDSEKKELGDGYCSNSSYIIKLLDGEKNDVHDESVVLDEEGHSHTAVERLFHANSVTTSLNYIRNKKMISRQRGEELGIQTAQKSDEVDRELGIYNDIFFDNVDIPSVSRSNQSAYGPVMFVFKTELLRGQKIRILKCNPWASENKEKLCYLDVFYSTNGLKTDIRNSGMFNYGRMGFLADFGHHTTVYDTSELDFADNLECLLIEKHASGDGRERELKALLESELAASGLNVPVYVRKDAPSRNVGLAADDEELWRFPDL